MNDELTDLLHTLIYDADAIYVRALFDGQWQNVPLSNLSPSDRAVWAARFIERRFPGSTATAYRAETEDAA